MADTVTSQVNFSGTNKYVATFTNTSDGTGESDVAKINISGLAGAPIKVKINKIWYDISGMAVEMSFDHDANDTVLVLGDQGFLDFTSFGGIQDPASTGGTGDVLFTTIGETANDTYTIIVELGLL